jgi:hypothetical protein
MTASAGTGAAWALVPAKKKGRKRREKEDQLRDHTGQKAKY